MTYRTILVSLNDVARCDALLGVTGELALRHDAHVVGLYVVPAVTVYPEVGMALVPSVFEGYQAHFMSKLAGVREKFENWMLNERVRGEWRAVDSLYPEIAASLIEHGRSADVVVISQTDASGKANIEVDLTTRVLMETGRPVLVVPQAWSHRTCGTIAVAGFNGGKEAARSLFDAVPLLKAAQEVRIVWVDPYKQRLESGEVPGADAAAALARHGIAATVEPLMTDGRNAGEALLMRARDVGADLVVMGAYAHSRLQEYVFGGATQHVLQHMTVPVLMSH